MNKRVLVRGLGLGSVAVGLFVWSVPASAFMEDIATPTTGACRRTVSPFPASVCRWGRRHPHAAAPWPPSFSSRARASSRGRAAWSTPMRRSCWRRRRASRRTTPGGLPRSTRSVDYGKFEAYDMQGQPLDATTRTPTMNGFVRTNNATGGTFFHYVSTYNGGSGAAAPGLDVPDPDLTDDTTELFLAHVRRWAQATRPPADLPRNRREQMIGIADLFSRVHHQEQSRAVGVLDNPPVQNIPARTSPPVGRPPLRKFSPRTQTTPVRLRQTSEARPHFGQRVPRHAELLQQLIVPSPLAEMEQHRARGVARIRCKNTATGEFPDDPRVNRPEYAAPRGQYMPQQPFYLCRREIRVADEPCALMDFLCETVSP